ncbi:MAG: PAS domain-containing protein [Acidobacteria bacterium]|nr:PAS domain-containing protein [Acidobacteriota bacterium]
MSGPEQPIGAERFGRLYRASGCISSAVVRSKSRSQLLNEIVQILVETAGFGMSFVVWLDPATQRLTPVARYGDATGYTERIRIFADDRPEGGGPSGIAFRTGQAYVCHDFMNDPSTVPWREAAAVDGWRASASIPVRMRGAPCGVLAVYSRIPNAFGPEELALFDQVLIDVSIGLERLEDEGQRREAEQALAASQLRLRLAVEAGGIGLWEYDIVTRRLTGDRRSEQLLGLAPGSFQGRYADFQRQVHPDDLSKLDQAAAQHSADGKPFSVEFRVIWPDGSTHWLESHGELAVDPPGASPHLRGAAFDVTARKCYEIAMREREERLTLAVRAAQIGFFDHDQVSGGVYWSPELRHILGVGPDEPASFESHMARIHPEDRARALTAIVEAHRNERSGRYELAHRFLLPAGEVRDVVVRAQTFFEGEGEARRPVRSVGAVYDVTERSRAESERRVLASVVEMSAEFIILATLEGRVSYANHAALRMAGLDDIHQARFLTIFDFFEGGNLQETRDGMFAALQEFRTWEGETRLRRLRQDASIDVAVTAFPVFGDGGAPVFYAVIARDISERKKAEAQKAKLEEKLFQAQKMESIGRLAGGVAHDFNNMLTVILGYVALARNRLTDTDLVASYLHEIENAAGRSRDLTTQLLGFSRRQVIAPEPMDLNVLLADLQQPLSRLIGEDIDLSVWPHPDLWSAALDSSQVNQILLNLVVNARDAMPSGGKITLETANVEISEEYCSTQVGLTPGQYVMLAVSDNGLGMSRQTLSHLFEPFFTTKEVGRGTGLGLATVYGIVKQNGGFINVYSEPNKGTTFRIYFPRTVGQEEAETPAAAEWPTGSGAILLVEDDELVRNVTRASLECIGYEPLVAASAEQALLLCERQDLPIRMILTDVVMSGMTGAELRDKVAAIRPEIKVLFMSGYTSNVIVNHGVLKKGVHFIQKPFTIEQLARKIAETLGGDLRKAAGA